MGIFKSKDTSADVVATPSKEGKKIVSAKKTVVGAGKKASTKKESMKDLYGGKTSEKTVVASSGEKSIANRGKAYKVLVKPLITEKAASQGAEDKYVFEVSTEANKIEIADAILEVYGIKPVAVNVLSMLGKKVRYGRTMGRRKDWKKAIVTMPKGKTINVYEGV